MRRTHMGISSDRLSGDVRMALCYWTAQLAANKEVPYKLCIN